MTTTTTQLKKIVAIGGSVIKTGGGELLKELVARGEIEMLIHNGASLFHDFQMATDDGLRARGLTSYPLAELIDDVEVNGPASRMVWEWLEETKAAPDGSLTRVCDDMLIPGLMFTVLGGDFWQLFDSRWNLVGLRMLEDFEYLCTRMRKGPFHYVCMGSAVVHPEVFIKAVAEKHPKDFRADVVDFKKMYRPRTRVAAYGNYYCMTHVEFLNKWIEGGFPE